MKRMVTAAAADDDDDDADADASVAVFAADADADAGLSLYFGLFCQLVESLNLRDRSHDACGVKLAIYVFDRIGKREIKNLEMRRMNGAEGLIGTDSAAL
uniref:Uncharacterized protein n=1 Tax=Syphacia muris TaxID=451379 RepID=A0A0N5A9Q6_9BILA